ncbi:hypothetical protein GHK35_15915, partial [Sinorhizobium meliloti]|nr:hypothetical protein [Sinorhizobium meliloti]
VKPLVVSPLVGALWGRIPAAGPRSRFCVLPVASFWACEGQTVYRLPQGNGPAGGSDVYMP